LAKGHGFPDPQLQLELKRGEPQCGPTETRRYAWVLRPLSEGTRSGLTGGGSVAERTVGLVSGRLLVGIASS
jgi:hypothetical protein